MSDDPQEAEVNGDPKSTSRDVQQQSKALNSITDYVEEKEMDASKVKQVRACRFERVFVNPIVVGSNANRQTGE